jgi:hypothetical protein
MVDSNAAAWGAGRNIVAASGRSPNVKGFTNEDMKALQETHRRGVADRGWGPAQFVVNEFSHYLAIWDAGAENAPPNLSIIRFSKTGTYALLINDQIVATGTTLGAVLPALTIAEAKDNLPVGELAEV